MLPKILNVIPLKGYRLFVYFDDETAVIYDVEEDMNLIESYGRLRTEEGLFENVKLDESRTCVFWTEEIDLPSDMIYEFGEKIEKFKLGKELARIRNDKNISVNEISKATGLNKTYIKRVESGEISPDIRKAVTLVSVLGKK